MSACFPETILADVEARFAPLRLESAGPLGIALAGYRPAARAAPGLAGLPLPGDPGAPKTAAHYMGPDGRKVSVYRCTERLVRVRVSPTADEGAHASAAERRAREIQRLTARLNGMPTSERAFRDRADEAWCRGLAAAIVTVFPEGGEPFAFDAALQGVLTRLATAGRHLIELAAVKRHPEARQAIENGLAALKDAGFQAFLSAASRGKARP